MGQNDLIDLVMTLLLGIFLQVLLVFADTQDSPSKAVMDFTKAYYAFDPSISDLMCEDQILADDGNVVDGYLYNAAKEAGDKGFGMFYMKDNLYDLETYTIINDDDKKAEVRITCKRKSPLRSFFDGGKGILIDKTFDVTLINGKWKVCGDLSSMFVR